MIRFSSAMLEQLNLTPGKDVVFSAGRKKNPTIVEKNMLDAKQFLIDSQIKQIICLRGCNQPLAFYYDKGMNELKIGPVVAILSGIPVMLLKPEVVSLYRTIALSAREAGMLFYIFTPDFIDFKQGTVNGFQYRASSRSACDWVMQEFPLPDVIYNQVGFISDDLMPKYRKLLVEYLNGSKNIKFINPSLALNDKLATYNILCKDLKVKEYLPESGQCTCAADILNMLEKYGAVHLKPTVSSLGRDVFKVSRKHNCYVIESHQPEGEKIKETFYSKEALSEKLQKTIMTQPYLVQKTIDLIHYENRPVDFRVHLFKDQQGCWDHLAIKARMGPVDGVITGLGWGGLRMQGEKLLDILFSPDEAGHIIKAIKSTTLELAGAIENLYKCEFGELGFDIGVDLDKRVWMIEVNPKPTWNVAPEVDTSAAEKNMAEYFLGYCRYLSGLNGLDISIGIPGNHLCL